MTLRLLFPLRSACVFAPSLVVAASSCSSPSTPHPKSVRAAEVEERTASLDPKKILYTLSGQDQVRRCLRSSPEAHGTVTLRWKVAPSGDVSDVQASTTLADPSVAQCLADEVGKLNFGHVDRASEARWTFVRHLDGLMLTSEREAMERKSRGRKHKSRGSGREQRPEGYDDGVSVASGSSGWLDPAAIEQRAHASLQLYAHCFRDGFARNRDLSGVVKLRLRIDEDGTVGSVRDGGSDLPDGEAVSCVAEGFYAMRFPRPEGGSVEVTYPVLFNLDE